MIAWRLCEERWADSAFSGEGARRLGGRWNSPGTAVVYASGSQALALLEQLVHFDVRHTPRSLLLFRVEFPDAVTERVESVPGGGNEPGMVGIGWTVTYGNQWLVERRSAALIVPSAVVPDEPNVLLNPNHPDIVRVEVSPPRMFPIDPRLLRRPGR